VPHVVLTDDDELFRESLGLNLADEGYDVTSFANGHDTLTYLQEGGEADVLLLDWRMPGMNGLEMLRELRRRGIMTPVIFLTGLGDDVYEEAALAGGAVDFIDKSRRLSILVQPVMPQAMAKTLDQLAVADDARSFDRIGDADALAAGTPLPPPQGVFPRYVEPETAA